LCEDNFRILAIVASGDFRILAILAAQKCDPRILASGPKRALADLFQTPALKATLQYFCSLFGRLFVAPGYEPTPYQFSGGIGLTVAPRLEPEVVDLSNQRF
jgi:hypothetical protein